VARATERLAPLGTITIDGHLLRLSVTDGAVAMLATVRALDAAQLEPITLALREPTLDDVFLSLTGHAAEAPTPPDDAASPPTRRSRRARTGGTST
jgi:ABC-2 type transport system ATP-binding protein